MVSPKLEISKGVAKARISVRICAVLCLLGLAAALTYGCTQMDRNANAQFDFSRRDPIEFLQFLENSRGRLSLYTITTPIEGWVREEHVAQLIGMLESSEECVPVVSEVSSTLATKSTVGREAAFLIHGFRNGRYPAASSAADARVDSRDELLEWWASRQRESRD